MFSSLLGFGIGTIVILLIIGFVPAIIAFKREHHYKWIILVLCFFSGFGLPWLIAMIWAVWPTDKTLIDPVVGNPTGKGKRNTGDTIGEASASAKRSRKANNTKECPDCAELVPAGARVCPHCEFKFPVKAAKKAVVAESTPEVKPAVKKPVAKKTVRVEPTLRVEPAAQKPVAKRERVEVTEPTFVDLMN
jgi:hypothetical protein